MNISTGLLLLFLLIAGVFLVESRRRGSTKRTPENEGPYVGPTADEQEATATGRYRVKQMLEKTKAKENKKESGDDEDRPLPDPFVKKS